MRTFFATLPQSAPILFPTSFKKYKLQGDITLPGERLPNHFLLKSLKRQKGIKGKYLRFCPHTHGQQQMITYTKCKQTVSLQMFQRYTYYMNQQRARTSCSHSRVVKYRRSVVKTQKLLFTLGFKVSPI